MPNVTINWTRRADQMSLSEEIIGSIGGVARFKIELVASRFDYCILHDLKTKQEKPFCSVLKAQQDAYVIVAQESTPAFHEMKLWTHTAFVGFYPVGSSAIVIAEDREKAADLLEAKLREIGLEQEILPEEFNEVDTKSSHAVILCDGDY